MKKIFFIISITLILLNGCSDKSDDNEETNLDETQQLNIMLENR